jgi:hypothetical protein
VAPPRDVLIPNLDHFRTRVLQDALTEATAAYWEGRADAFDWAAPKSTDFRGQATDAELADRAQRCRDTGLACRRNAQLIRESMPAPIEADVWTVVLEELAAA